MGTAFTGTATGVGGVPGHVPPERLVAANAWSAVHAKKQTANAGPAFPWRARQWLRWRIVGTSAD